MTASVLVCDGEQRSALAVVRSLGRARHAVHVCSHLDRSIAGGSRYAISETTVPNPLASPVAFADSVYNLARSLDIEILLPVTDVSILALGARRSLAGVRVPGPTLDAFRRISDKATLTKVASTMGVKVPAQKILHSPTVSLRELEGAGYPLVLKPARSVIEVEGTCRKLVVRWARTAEEAEKVLQSAPAEAYPILAQQVVAGPGVGVFLLRWEGRTIAAFSHRRLREKPPAGGVSVYRESVALDASLLRSCEALLDSYDWTGVAMVEFKLDESSGTAYLMEVNGRFWGSLQLAVDAGVDFPKLLLDAAVGGNPERVDDYRLGVRSRWWWGDFDHLLARFREGDKRPAGLPGRGRSLVAFLTLWRRGDRSEVWRLRDPRPFARETKEWFRALGR